MTTPAPKRRKLASASASAADDDSAPAPKTSRRVQKDFFKNASSWNLEQDYESRQRKSKKKDRKDNGRLPIKTSDGVLQQQEPAQDDAASVESDADWGDEDNVPDTNEVESKSEAPPEPQLPVREQVRLAKEELAKAASILNEDPEEHPEAFNALARVGRNKAPAVRKLVLVTQLAVYKDLIPGYRIRQLSDDAMKDKISKEVRRTWTYEQSLVSGYQTYIKDLTLCARGDPRLSPNDAQALSAVAVNCACTLLTTVPHFNFRSDLVKILVGKLSKRGAIDAVFEKCRKTLETVFRDDEEGRPSMDAVSLLTKMMRSRDYNVHEGVLNLFLHLRLLSEFSGSASRDQSQRNNAPSHKTKNKKEFRTKKLRKAMKEQKIVEKDMAQADALVSHEERDHMQSEILKLVFATYFRILKARKPHLMGAVLEGLARYAHLINQDFFGDLLEALKDLIRHSENDEEVEEEDADEPEDALESRNTSREALLCVVTAFALLAGQDAHNSRSNLHLDLSFFTTHLFRSLIPLSVHPDLELGARSLHLPDPDAPAARQPNRSDNKINLQTTTVLLIRCLTAIMLPPWNMRSVPPSRLAAFTKSIMSTSLHMPEKSCQASLALLQDVAHTHASKISALWNTEERRGDGTYNPLSDSVEGSNPFAATVWEGELLKRHYCPKVREGVKILEKTLSG